MLVFKKGHRHPGLKKTEVHLGESLVKEYPQIYGVTWKTSRQPIAYYTKRGSAIPPLTIAPLFVKRTELLKRRWVMVQLPKGLEILMSPEEVASAKKGVIHEKMIIETYWHGLFRKEFEHPLKAELKVVLLKKFK